MAQKLLSNNWMSWGLVVTLLWICPVFPRGNQYQRENDTLKKLRACFIDNKEKMNLIVADNFDGVISGEKHLPQYDSVDCIIFLQSHKNETENLDQKWPQMENKSGSFLLHISKWHVNNNQQLCVVIGENCTTSESKIKDSTCNFSQSVAESCQVLCFHTECTCKHSTYDEDYCTAMAPQVKDKYIINITVPSKNCHNCDNPVKIPEKKIKLNETTGDEVEPVKAVEVMNQMAYFAATINEPSASFSAGDGVSGVLVKETEPVEVSFAYLSPNESIHIIGNRDNLAQYTRSVTVSKEAFEKAVSQNVGVPFASVFRFINMAKDELDSIVLGNEVIAVEMGANITDLSNKISISFCNITYTGIPSCHSWNGEGNLTKWTQDNCSTRINGDNITCECSHLTFFAILLAPLNETILSSDQRALTIITQVGCGVSMFFLCLVFFTHFLQRKNKASKATTILINLVFATFLLNLTFLLNNFVAELKNSVACEISAALMHWFMLTTFTWFAVQAFHLCLQLYKGGNIKISHYIFKVSIISWVLPCIVWIVLLITGKYGEQVIHTEDTEKDVAMCWITDSEVHHIVNIGYYSLVFTFTFTVFIIILSWLFCLRRTKTASIQISKNSKHIITLLGLCYMLGITWGFAFFASGVLRIPAYYIFTVLNSLQGFFLFIYYHSTRCSEVNTAVTNNTNSITLTSLNIQEMPYTLPPIKK